MARGSANNVIENRSRPQRNTPTQAIEEEQTNSKETKPSTRRKNAAGMGLSKKVDSSKVEESGETSFAENKMEASKKNQSIKAVGRKRKVENLEETSKEPEPNDALERRSVRGQVKKLKAGEMEESSQNVEVGIPEEVDMSAIHDESSQNSNKSDTLRRTRSAKKSDGNTIKEHKDTKDFKTKGKKIQIEIKRGIVDDASQDSNKPAKSGPARKTRKAQQIAESITVEEKESILDEVNQIINADKHSINEEVVDRSSQASAKPVKTRNTRRAKKVEETNVEMSNEDAKDIEIDNLVLQAETDTAAMVKMVTRKTRNAKRIENDANDDTSQDSGNITKSESSRKTRRTTKTKVNIDADSKDVETEDKHSSLAEKDREHVSKTNITPDILDDNSLDSIKSNQSGITKSGTLRRTRNSERIRDDFDKQNAHIEKAELCSSEDMESSSDANCILKGENPTENISIKEIIKKDCFKDLDQDEKEIKNAEVNEDSMPETENLNQTGERKNNGEEMEQCTGDINNAIGEKCAEKEESYRDEHQINAEKRSQNLKENLIDSSKSDLLLEVNDSVKIESVSESNEFSKSADVLSHQENTLNPPSDASGPTYKVQESDISFKESNMPMDEGDTYQTSSMQTNDDCDINAEKFISGNETFVQSSNQADNSDTNQSETEAMFIEKSIVGSSENIDHGYSANVLMAEKSEKPNIDIDVCSDKTEDASVANFELESSTTDSDTGNLVIEENFQDNLFEANSSELPSIVGRQNVGDSNTVDKLSENIEDGSSVKFSTPVSEPSIENITCVNDNGSNSFCLSHVEDVDFTSSTDEIPSLINHDTNDSIDYSSNETSNKIDSLHNEHIDDLASTSESNKLKSLQSGKTSEETEDNVATNSIGDVCAASTNAQTNSETANEEPKQELYTTCRNSDEIDSSPVETETPSLQGGISSPSQLETDSYHEEKNIDSAETQKNKKRKKSNKKEESPDIEISKGGKRIITTYEVSSNVGDSAKRSLASEGDGRSEASIGIKIKRKRVEEAKSDHNVPPSDTVSGETDIHEQAQQLFGNFQSEPGPSGTQQPTRKSSRKKKQDSDQESRENSAAPIRMYLEKFVPFLLEGLLKITYVRPEDPIQYLADWMKENKEAAYTSILKREQASEE